MVLVIRKQARLHVGIAVLVAIFLSGFVDIQAVSAKGFVYGGKTRFTRVKFVGTKFRFPYGKWFTAPPSVPLPPAPPPAGVTVNVRNYGAKGDGKADDLGPINQAIGAAGTNGTVYFPAGTYAVSNVLTLTNQSVNGDGASSKILSANRQSAAAMIINGSGTVSNVQIQGTSQANGLVVQNVTAGSFAVRQTIVQGPFGSALTLNNASNGIISGCRISNFIGFSQSTVVGIRLGDHCNNIQIDGNTFDQLSHMAIHVSPAATRSSSVNLTISNNVFASTNEVTMSIVAVSNCRILNNSLDFTYFQGAQFVGIRVYGSDEPHFGPSSDVQIIGNRLLRCGSSNSGAIELGGWAHGGQPGLRNVQVSNNLITQAPIVLGTSLSRGIATRGNAGGIANLSITGNTLTGTGVSGIWVNNSVNTTIASNTINDGTGEGIYMLPTNGGTLSISSNSIVNMGSAVQSLIDQGAVRVRGAIDVDKDATTAYTAVSIINNGYNPPANKLQHFVYCGVSRSIANVSGNQTSTMLPTFVAP